MGWRKLRRMQFGRVRVPRFVTALLTVALLAAGLTIPPGTPTRAADDLVQDADQPPVPTWVAAGAGELKYVERSLTGLVTDEYGHSLVRAPDESFLRKTVSHHVYGEGGTTVERAIVDDVDWLGEGARGPGDITPGDVELVTVGVDHGSGARRLEVRGPYEDGFDELRASFDIGTEAGEPKGLAIGRDTSANALYINVISTTGFRAFRFDGSTNTISPAGHQPPNETDQLPDDGSVASSGTILPGDILDAYQRPPWEHATGESVGQPNRFAVTGLACAWNAAAGRCEPGDGKTLRTLVYEWDPGVCFCVLQAGSYANGDVGANAEITDARVRYDSFSWSDPGALATLHRTTADEQSWLTTFGVPYQSKRSSNLEQRVLIPTSDGRYTHPCLNGTESLPDLDVEARELPFKTFITGFGTSEFTVAYGCAGVVRNSSTDGDDELDLRLMQLHVRSQSTGEPSVHPLDLGEQNHLDRSSLRSLDHFTQPSLSLTFPCKDYLERFMEERQTTNRDCATPAQTSGESTASTVAMNVLVRSVDADRNKTSHVSMASHSWLERAPTSGLPGCPEPNPPNPKACQISRNDVPVFDVRDSTGSHASPFVFARLPDQRRHLKIRFMDIDGNGEADIDHEQTDPIPIVLLASPPYVAGAGQQMNGPFFGQTTSSTEDRQSSWETTVTLYGGVDIEVEAVDNPLPGPDVGFDIEALLHGGVGTGGGSGQSKTVSFTEKYSGAPNANSIVYRVDKLDVRRATIEESSAGTGIGDVIEFVETADTAVSTTTQEDFLNRFTDVRRQLEGPLDEAFPTAGDPRSYLSYTDDDKTQVDQYCIGQVDASSTTPTDIPGFTGLKPNPFFPDDLGSGPDILVSAAHEVQAGSSNISGAEISIDESESKSRLQSFNFGAELYVTYGMVRAGVEVDSLFTGTETRSLTSGVTFGGEVSNIPNAELSREGYSWRTLLCKRELARGMPVWVLNYTVKDYTGSGGLHALRNPELVSPIHSKRVDSLTPHFEFTLEDGTVRSFDLELEAVGAEDHRTFDDLLEVDTTKAANERIPDLRDGKAITWLSDLQQADPEIEPLLAGQLYRWRLVANDFFDRQSTSDWEFFTTSGPPSDLEVDVDDSTPDVDQVINVTATHSPTTITEYRLDAGDGRDPIVQGSNTFQLSYPTPGLYVIEVAAVSPYGTVKRQALVSVGPTAKGESYDATEDTELQVDAPGVLANDSGATNATLVVDALHGTVTLRPDGGFDYTPAANYCHDDSFGYAISAGGTTRRATATIHIACVNDAPTVSGLIERTTQEDTDFGEGVPGLLANATDVESGATLSVKSITEPAHGDNGFTPLGAWGYRPDQGFCGDDGFDYTVTDGQADVTGHVTIHVTCVNSAPVGGPYSATMDEDGTSSMLLLASDPEGDTPITWRTGSQPAHGTSTVDGDGRWTYSPTADFCGTDTMSAFAKDSKGAESELSLTAFVTCINDAPVAHDVSGTTNEDTSGGGAFDGTDVDGDAVTLAVASQPSKGTAAVDPNDAGRWKYTPNANLCGTDSFTYTASDGTFTSTPATVSVTITCTNDAPVGVSDDGAFDPTYRVDEDGTLDVPAPGVLGNDTDPDGDDLSVVSVTPAANGSIQIARNGSVQYVPSPGFSGIDTATYTLQDPGGSTSTATIRIAVRTKTITDARPPVTSPADSGAYRVSATLTSASAARTPYVGERIAFTSGTKQLCAGTTDSTGTAFCDVDRATRFSTTTQYTATFNGTAFLLPSSDTEGSGQVLYSSSASTSLQDTPHVSGAEADAPQVKASSARARKPAHTKVRRSHWLFRWWYRWGGGARHRSQLV